MPLLSYLIKGGGLGAWPQKCTERPQVGRRCVFRQIFRQITSNCMNEIKKVLWQRFWLDLCTKQVVSARACTYHFLPYNSSGIKLSGKRTVQTGSCLNPEHIDTLFISVGGQEGVLVGGGHFGPEAQTLHLTVRNFCYASCNNCTYTICMDILHQGSCPEWSSSRLQG